MRRRRTRRIILWSVVGLVVAASAAVGGSYLWLHSLVESSHPTDPGIAEALRSTPESAIGTPTGMDILLIGSDRRPDNSGEETRSDTVILVHADPDENYLSALSFPRDLPVEIPGHGLQKLNAAYAFGGPELTIKTIKQLTGVDIKHYVGVDFQAFSDITDELGGVYVDVDRRYYNDDPQWELIKISPGYQLLDGSRALDYVRFRHDLNYDFGRMERQQRFMTALREQAMGWNLPLKLPGLVSALFKNLTTTLGTNDIIKLAAWGVRLSGDRIRLLSITGDIQTRDGVSYVITPEGAVAEAVQELMTPPTAATGEQGTTSGDATGSGTSTSTTTTALDSPPAVSDPDQIPDSRLWKLYADSVPFQVMGPGYLPSGYGYVDRMPVEFGTYEIDPGDDDKVALKVVYRLTRGGEVTDQYMGITETNWLDAPAASEGQEVERNGITYTFVGTTLRTERIWWIEEDVLYWVSNTLSYVLNRKDLLNVAQSMIVVPQGVVP